MHSMGINLLVGRCTVRPVLGTFTKAPLTSLSDLLLISSITLPIRDRCLGALSSSIKTTSLTLIYGELLFKDLNFWYSRKFVMYVIGVPTIPEMIDISQFFSMFINICFYVYWSF